MGDTFLTLTYLDYLTNHISLKLSSFLQIKRSVFITTGTFTRVDYLRINKFNLPWKFQNFAIDSMAILTNTILYNCMIVIGIYHRFFNLMEQSHPL